MYRRGDPRWNRTFQSIADNIEHANESAQENLYSFTHSYVNPCLSSVTQCLNACTAPCLPLHNDRRRHRGRSRGRAELSFDFYDDWEEDESEGLLGWGNENFWGSGGSSNYGTNAQPGRQNTMNYGARTRDNRYNTGRRKSAVQPHDGLDPTIIPSSSYFGFLGRLPFKIGGKVLRYRPSAADLTEHPGARRSLEEEQPLIEDSDEERANETKGHRRQRSHTNASGHTTDSLSSRGDIFPSEDEDDAVPLDDEFTAALERRTTGQWYDDTSSNQTRSKKKKRPSAGSRMSTRTISSRNTHESANPRRSTDSVANTTKHPASETISEVQVEAPTTLADLQQEEERARAEEEAEVARKRQDAQQLALKRGLVSASDQDVHLRAPLPSPRPHPRSPSSTPSTRMSTVRKQRSHSPLPPTVDAQTMPDSSAFHVDESDVSSLAPTPSRPLSIKDERRENDENEGSGDGEEGFVPARLPNFG